MDQLQLYLSDNQTVELATRILAIGRRERRCWVVLEDNIFHPPGGGQPADVGHVDDLDVVATRHQESSQLVSLEFSDEASERAVERFRCGGTVTATLNLLRRREHSALHTSGHLIHAAVIPLGLHYASCNHYPGEARVDFLMGSKSIEAAWLSAHVKACVEKQITSCAAVHSSVSPDGGRIVVVDGVCEDRCAGTHVAHLGDLKNFQIRSVKIKGGRLRVGYDVTHQEVRDAEL